MEAIKKNILEDELLKIAKMLKEKTHQRPCGLNGNEVKDLKNKIETLLDLMKEEIR